MKTCIVTSFPDKKGELSIEEISALGYQGIELAIREPKKERKNLLKELAQHQLKVVSLLTGKSYHLDNLRFSAHSRALRTKAETRLKEYIDLASEINSCVLIGYMRGRKDDGSTTDAEAVIYYHLQRCDEYASIKGVKLLFEPLNRYCTDFINTIEECVDMIKELSLKSTFIIADTFHMNIEESRTIDKTIFDAGSCLEHVHVSENNRKIPGQGCLPWLKFFSALKKMNYDKYISIEARLGKEQYCTAQTALDYLKKMVEA